MDPQKLKTIVGMSLFCLGALNFFAFMAMSTYLGGDAFNGYVADGHYFLRNHGRIIETTRTVFEYSRIHVLSVMVTHPLAIFGGWLAFGWRRRPG
jgi:hypothetical protein